VVAMSLGKRWDDDAEQWLHYDLAYEAYKLLGVSDGEFIAMITADADNQRITPQAFYTNCLVEDIQMTRNPFTSGKSSNVDAEVNQEKKQVRTVLKKNVVDRELYDVLGGNCLNAFSTNI